MWIFLLGDDFWIYFRVQCFLVRQWIHVSFSLRRLLYSDPAIDSRPALICFRTQRNAWSSVVHVMRLSTDWSNFMFFFVKRWIMDLEVDSRHVFRPFVSGSHLLGASPEEYMIWIFWEMTSGIFPYTVLLVRQWIHVWRQSTRLWRVSHIFYVNVNSDPEGTSWLSLSTETGIHSANCAADREDLTGTVLGLVVDAPVVQRQVPWFRRYRIPWRFRSCSSQLRFIDKVFTV